MVVACPAGFTRSLAIELAGQTWYTKGYQSTFGYQFEEDVQVSMTTISY